MTRMRYRYYEKYMTERLLILTAEEFEAKAKAAGLSIAEVCRRAKVAQSTFHRWKTGYAGMNLGSYAKLIQAVQDTESVQE